MRQSRLLLFNAVVVWITQILRLFPQLIIVPFLIRTIGETGYGDYTLVWSLMTSVESLHRSLQSGVIKYGAAFFARDEMHKVNMVVSSSFVYSLIIGLVTFLGVLGLSFFYGTSTNVLSSSLIVVSLMVLFIFPLTPFTAIIQSRHRYYIGEIAETLWKYISLLAVFIWFQVSDPSLISLIIIMASLLVLARLGQIPFAYKLVPDLKNRLRFFDRETFKLIASFGGLTVLISAALAINTTGVRWLMGELISSTFVAHMAIMLMPATLLSMIVAAFTQTIMPATSTYEAKGNHLALQMILQRGIRYTSIILFAGLPAAILLMRGLLDIWVGEDYIFLTPYALLLFIGKAFQLSTSTAHQMLKGLDHQRKALVIYFIGLVLVPLLLILFLLDQIDNPYLATSIGLASGWVVCGLLQFVIGAKMLKLDIMKLIIRSYCEPLAPLLIIAPGLYLFIKNIQISGFISVIILSAAAGIIYLGLLYLIIATENEKKQVRELLISTQIRIRG